MKIVTEIKVIKEIDEMLWFSLDHASGLKFTYLDMVHFFGEPRVYEDSRFIVNHNINNEFFSKSYNRRVEWIVAEFNTNGKPKLDDNGEPVICTIYDSDASIGVEDNFIWHIDALVSRGFEIVGEHILNQRREGKIFVSKDLPEDIAKQDKDEMLKVYLSPDQKKMMKILKKNNDDAKKNNPKYISKPSSDKSIN